MLAHLASRSKRHPDADPRRWTQTLSASSSPGTVCLRMYIAQAQLPPMPLGSHAPILPPDGHKSHRNLLSVRAEDWRKLREMAVLSSEDFAMHTMDFTQTYIPSHDLGAPDPDQVSGERLTVPCHPVFKVAETTIGQSSDMFRVSRWVIEYPLATLQRVLHLVFPSTQEWSFSPVMADPDDDIVACTTWDRRNPDRSVDTAVAVMIQPPWVASAADLRAFVNCQRLPRPQIDPETGEIINEYSCKERMWAKLSDYCTRTNCHYFVVTTYWGWVFGAFSRARTRGFVTAVKQYDASQPTILEYLVFHFASAMKMSDGWQVPEVAEPVFDVNIGVADSIIPPDPFAGVYSRPPSESTWEASSHANVDAISSADSDEVVKLLLTPPGVQNAAILPPPTMREHVEEKIMDWQLTGVPLSPYSNASEISSAVTISSAASTYVDEIRANGDFLTERPIDTLHAFGLAI